MAVVGCLRLGEGSDCREFFALWRGAAAVRFLRLGGGESGCSRCLCGARRCFDALYPVPGGTGLVFAC